MPKRKQNDKMNLRLPLVVILGSTGSGKTKLSLDLAKKFSGEIIGADSMQIYKALDVITAKATKDERKIAKHHMIDILEPHETYTVLDYRNKAVPIIERLLNEKKLPIVVGGTNYYIESLLWKILVEKDGDERKNEPGFSENNEHTLESEELHEKLKVLDPEMAQRIHPNNKRKILRSLEVLRQKGQKHSEILKEQQKSFGGSTQGGGLRYPNSVILWLQCQQNILDERLNKRVDSMIEQGLLDELRGFHENYNIQRLKEEKTPDYTKGIFQSIGFKEFHDYLYKNVDENEKKSLLEKGIEDLKMVTRRYARKQVKWVKNRFLGRKDREVPPVYGLPTEDVSKWDEYVTKPAIEIIESYLNDVPCKISKMEPVDIKSVPNSLETSRKCKICDRIFIGDYQYDIHIASNRHKRKIQALNKKNRVLNELEVGRERNIEDGKE